MSCYCGKESQYTECCEPYIQGEAVAPTAEALMRSRYSAYCVSAVDYLITTTHSRTRRFHKAKDIAAWSKENHWLQLKIVASTATTVTFIAYYLDTLGRTIAHKEHSRFAMENGLWYYVDGDFA
jgi:SEC-C motif-containing protein